MTSIEKVRRALAGGKPTIGDAILVVVIALGMAVVLLGLLAIGPE